MTDAPQGRRERNKHEKRTRILAEAGRLFAKHGYAATTTSAIAEAADVSHGTLFRYAPSKPALMLMVGNATLSARLAKYSVAGHGTPTDRIVALVAPFFDDRTQLENLVAYQRAALDGDPHEEHCAEAVAIVERLIDAIGELLLEVAERPDSTDGAHLAAEAIYASLHLQIELADRDGRSPADLTTHFRGQTELIVRGYLATVTGKKESND
ncbi:TetR/AcrR family transcriptional regulator [Gulosibacter sp. ACHW.36C]|uniref:TetR/AcrR family transcriptional regulator n=1 Tax=Gulosibacter sediminis TaxID=1729695 RepID=A0ABY4N0H8_9MICO|nr:TetR/AcrR family transcriptional regulator [Gulosibacter sediminis]UQN15445.1 TetR/AcrR family transcriptional regulator [Gulosibacter sediminis]